MTSFNKLINKIDSDMISALSDSSAKLFPAIAEEILTANSTIALDFKNIFESVLERETLPDQYYSADGFGEFNITLVKRDQFQIHLYVMNKYDTNIHDHPFEGAFKVLEGQSLHLEYSFQSNQTVVDHLDIGELKVKSKNILKKGDTQQIRSNTIHYLTRIEERNISLIILRPLNIGNASYLFPGIRVKNINSLGEVLYRKLNFFNKSFFLFQEQERTKYFKEITNNLSCAEIMYLLLESLGKVTDSTDQGKILGTFYLDILKETIKSLQIDEKYSEIEEHLMSMKRKALLISELNRN